MCLMGPGYFTRGGHFMVLVAIDKNDCVTVADVGSRVRSAYKYRLSDVIAQSKGASAGGPFRRNRRLRIIQKKIWQKILLMFPT